MDGYEGRSRDGFEVNGVKVDGCKAGTSPLIRTSSLLMDSNVMPALMGSK